MPQTTNNHLSWFSALAAQADAGEKPIIKNLNDIITKDTFNEVSSFLNTTFSGKTEHFDYTCKIIHRNKDIDPYLSTGKTAAYFTIELSSSLLECSIVINEFDEQTNYTEALDKLLHEYGHYRSLIDYCITHNPPLQLPMQTKSGSFHRSFADFDNDYNTFLIKDARSIFKEELMACFEAFKTIDTLPISSQKKFALQNSLQYSATYTLQYYANNIEKLIEQENANQ